MPRSQTEFLIIGQGLAGSILAMKLMLAGRTVKVLDADLSGSASKVAAGIINPITGHRLNITDDFYQYLPCARAFYEELQNIFGCPIYLPIKQQRLIKNAGQKEYLTQRLAEPAYRNLIQASDKCLFADAPFGTIDVSDTFIVDVPQLLASVKQHLSEQGSYETCVLDYSELAFSPHIHYKDIEAQCIIFCEGHQAINNPWLADLPFKLAKGEVLSVEMPAGIDDQMLSWGNWLVPNGATARLGSNYLWDDTSEEINVVTKTKLLESLAQATGITAKCTKHESGVRPTTKHRVPFIGAISDMHNAYCFNGFGSKGCLTMPYFADQLISNITKAEPLSPELHKWL